MVKMAVRGISKPHFQMTVVKIQVHFQNEGAVYQHNIWKQSGMPCIIMAIFGKGLNCALVKALNCSTTQISFPRFSHWDFFPSFSPVPLCLLSLELECYSRHKDHELITYSQAQMWG